MGETVNIIGAGNAAMDVARTVIRKGARNVTVFSRTESYAASRVEAEMAMIDGVKFEYNKSPVEITDEGVIFEDVVCDENENVVEYLGSHTLYRADSTIISVSQGPSSLIPNKTEGLHTNKRGLVMANPEGLTDIPGVFASGDVVRGAKTVVEAVANSKKVADAMDEYLQKQGGNK